MATRWEKGRWRLTCRNTPAAAGRDGPGALAPRPQSTPLGRRGATQGHPHFCSGVLMTLERSLGDQQTRGRMSIDAWGQGPAGQSLACLPGYSTP